MDFDSDIDDIDEAIDEKTDEALISMSAALTAACPSAQVVSLTLSLCSCQIQSANPGELCVIRTPVSHLVSYSLGMTSCGL